MFRHVHLYSLGSLIFIIALFLSPITANHSLGESTNHIYNPQSDFVTQITNPAATDSSKLAENAITSPSAASFPFYDGFESGSLSSSWSTDTTNDGRVDVSASYPYTGTYSLLLDDSVSDSTYSYAAAILTIDLASQSDVELDFWWDEFGTDDSREGVFISADNGTNWHQIMNFSADPGGWRYQVIDLDAEAASAGITYNDHFQIKFQFYSNYSIANDDGYAFDEVRVRSKPTISPASFPFYDGFEAGALNGSWQIDFTNEGRVQVGTSHPYTGTYSLLLDDFRSDSIYSYAAAILTIDLASQSRVVLDFWWDEFGTDDSREGVFISADNGTNWHQIMNFSADPGGWRHQIIDLDAETVTAGMTYNDHFQIMFQFYSNYSIANDDGYAFDEVRVRSKPTPVPASFPFYDGFESGALSDSWQIDFTNEGRVQVGTSYPYAGTYSLLLDDFRSDSIYSYADAILTIDLAGQSGVVLDFWWDEFGTDDSREGVFISADNGTNWYQIMNFSVDPGGWRHQIIDLDAETVTAGMTYNDHFQIMFQFYSNYSIANDDGYAFDEVRVRANAAPVLSWVGDDDYTKDGLHPEHGDPGDNYLYRIKYADPDGDPPGDVKVQIQKDDAAIPGSPFVISCGDEDYTNGVICSYTQSGLASGTDYSYFFVAQDDQGNSATPTTKMDAPDVDSAIFLPMVANLTAPPGSAPLLEEISNPDGDYKFTVSWSAVDRATSYTLEQDSDSAFSNPTAVSSGPETLTSITVRNTGTFYYRVKAVNPVGESAWSNTQSTVVTNEPPACPSAGVWRGTTNYGKSLNITVIDIPSCYVDSVVMYFGICGGYKTTFYKDTPIVNNHFYMGGEDNHVSGDFISSTEAEGKFYLSMDCPTFPPVWVYLEGTWNATYQP